jgi:hypothetical protein
MVCLFLEFWGFARFWSEIAEGTLLVTQALLQRLATNFVEKRERDFQFGQCGRRLGVRQARFFAWIEYRCTQNAPARRPERGVVLAPVWGTSDI